MPAGAPGVTALCGLAQHPRARHPSRGSDRHRSCRRYRRAAGERAAGLPAVRFGNSARIAVGNQVLATGNALGLGGSPTVSQGIISATGRSITAADQTGSNPERLHGLLQTDAQLRRPARGRGRRGDRHGHRRCLRRDRQCQPRLRHPRQHDPGRRRRDHRAQEVAWPGLRPSPCPVPASKGDNAPFAARPSISQAGCPYGSVAFTWKVLLELGVIKALTILIVPGQEHFSI